MTTFSVQNEPSERETSENTCITNPDFSSHFSKVESGLEFMLSHFSEPIFPRKIATTATAASRKYQQQVDDKDRAMLYYKAALWEDCRIAAFGIGQVYPNLIFIELDAEDFASMRAFKLALTATLKNIKEKLDLNDGIVLPISLKLP
jgi:hypothetical protein